jgi:predicted dehydrogenase
MKIAIIGFGFMGGMHAQIYSALPGVELVAIADPQVDASRAKAAKMGLDVQVFPDLESLLAGAQLDAVDVCLPTNEHAALAIAAAEAGKHVFIEKPRALSLEDCAAIQAAVEKAGVYAQVGQCIRFWPEYVALKSFIESGKGGALKSLSLHRRASRPSYSQNNWLNDEARSGGAATDLHIHDTDFVLHLLGSPKSVTSQASRGPSGPDHIFTAYQYDKVAVHAEGGWDYPKEYGFSMAFEAVFERAALRWDSASGDPLTLTLDDQAPAELPVEQAGPQESTTGEGNISALGGYFNELEYFVNCLREGRAPEVATLAQATESMRVIRAELESAQTGQPVQL